MKKISVPLSSTGAVGMVDRSREYESAKLIGDLRHCRAGAAVEETVTKRQTKIQSLTPLVNDMTGHGSARFANGLFCVNLMITWVLFVLVAIFCDIITTTYGRLGNMADQDRPSIVNIHSLRARQMYTYIK